MLPIDKTPPKGIRRPDDSRKIDVPLDVHPGRVQGDHTALSVPRRAFDTLHGGWTKLGEAAKRVKDTDKLAKEARSHTKRVLASVRIEQDHCKAACRHLSDKIGSAICPNPGDPMGVEIRRFMIEHKDPVKAATQAVQNGDRRVIAAVLNAPPQLSGLTHEQLNTLTSMARRTLEPTDFAALEQLQKHSVVLQDYTERFEKIANEKIARWETGDDEALLEIFADG